jgi:hypothetical protein
MEQNTRTGVGNTGQDNRLLDEGTQESVEDTARQVQEQARQAAAQAQDKATDLGHKVADQAREAGHQAERIAVEQMERGRHEVARGVHTVSEALRLGAEQVRQREGGPGAEFIERLAEPVERISDYLESHDTSAIASDLQNFARRNEALFLGGAFALGMLGARFLKASSQDTARSGDMYREDQWELRQRTARVYDAERDAVGRPRAPGYEPPTERGATTRDDWNASGPRNA